MKRHRRLGEMLLQDDLITKEELDKVIAEGKKNGKRIGHVLIEKGILTEKALINFLEKQLDMPVVEINKDYTLKRDFFKLISQDYYLDNLIAPLSLKNGVFKVAMADPTNFEIIEELRFMADAEIEECLSTEQAIYDFLTGEGIRRKERVEDGSSNPIGFSEGFTRAVTKKDKILSEQKLVEMADDAPVITLVNRLIEEAVYQEASDIHIECYENFLKVRYRIDGILIDIKNPPDIGMHAALVSRIKIISELDISERRLPQDGRIGMNIGDKKVDLRVSIIPAVHGENVVMRILDKSSVLLGLDDLGLPKKDIEQIKRLIAKPHGLFLLAGPTGSGKTTTLYGILQFLKGFDNKILTIEDPVEYQLDGITQVQTHADIGLDFAHGLRSFLRHDPDVIMVGETRDLETAEIAVRSALTGHMVLTTVHTNDSPSAVTRFVDMGIPAYLVAATINMVVSQRLVRKICPKCKTKVKLTKKSIASMNMQGKLKEGMVHYKGKGCDSCYNSGYKGRVAVFELMEITEPIRDSIIKNNSLSDLKKVAKEQGMKPLIDQVLQKVRKGETTLEEALRIGSMEGIDYDELF